MSQLHGQRARRVPRHEECPGHEERFRRRVEPDVEPRTGASAGIRRHDRPQEGIQDRQMPVRGAARDARPAQDALDGRPSVCVKESGGI